MSGPLVHLILMIWVWLKKIITFLSALLQNIKTFNNVIKLQRLKR